MFKSLCLSFQHPDLKHHSVRLELVGGKKVSDINKFTSFKKQQKSIRSSSYVINFSWRIPASMFTLSIFSKLTAMEIKFSTPLRI